LVSAKASDHGCDEIWNKRERENVDMSVSHDTAAKVLEVLSKYVPPDQMTACIDDLRMIPGNKSFRETIWLIRSLWRAK
jgi:hypothetical protein